MLQQWLLLAMLAAGPQPQACPDVVHVPDEDVAHVPEADIDPWLDPATAELVTTPKPRIERRVGDNGVWVDVDIPEGLVEGPQTECKE